jgi:hypothetical protein
MTISPAGIFAPERDTQSKTTVLIIGRNAASGSGLRPSDAAAIGLH